MAHPPIYIINLERTPERKSYMQRQLDALNLNYHFVEAIDKYDLNSKAYRTKIASLLDIDEIDMELLHSKSYSDGKLACLLSHIKAQDLVVKNNARYACILEDDVRILSTFPKILTVAGKMSWDVLMLSSHTKFIRNTVRELYTFKFRGLYKLIRYKKYYPQLNSFTARLIAMKLTKLIFKRLQSKIGREASKQSGYITADEEFQRRIMSLACEIGGLPDQNRCAWNKVMPKYYLAPPYKKTRSKSFNLTSGMAYMLTPSAAHWWKREAILSVKGTNPFIPIDCLPFELYKKNDLSLYIIIPCCVRASCRFLVYSSHTR